MKAQDFALAWSLDGDELAPFDPITVNALDVSENTKDFLIVGLPVSAAPFLRFGRSSGAWLQSASQEFDLPRDFSRYKIIGFNAYGDPICIDEDDGSVIYLNHDDEFGWVYMNQSVAQLAEFLLIFRNYVKNIESALLSERSKIAATTISQMKKIDPFGIENGQWLQDIAP